jgi:hypothetical protein
VDGACTLWCPAGQQVCGTRCATLASDPAHCGACGNACFSHQRCVDGACTSGGGCGTGFTLCGGSCLNVQTDRAHCGMCGNACPPAQVCQAGRCVLLCPMGFSPCGGRCVDLQTDRTNCGMCGTTCGDGQVCTRGVCAPTCPMGTVSCVDRCVDTTTDRTNCGACARACVGRETCTGGMCMLGCPTGYTNCGGTCVNLQVDAANCGACGVSCGTGYACGSGLCRPLAGADVPGCAAPSQLCGPICTDVRNDNVNCGMCGRACAGDRRCEGGTCVTPCAPGEDRCAGVCTNIRGDRNNCGSCGFVCPTGLTCSGGTCTTSIHNSMPFTATMAATGSCAYMGMGMIRWENLGSRTWRECIVEASRRGAMLGATQYTMPMGWYSHRRGTMAMTGVWSTYREQAITTPTNCIIARDPAATRNDAPLSNTTSYDGQTWHYQDYGMRYFDECQTLAGNAGAMVITPYTIGMTTGDDYWVNSVHACNTYEWITGGGTGYGNDNVGVGARSSMRNCMVGYVDN